MLAPKILVVDDEQSITVTLALILKQAGFQVSTANDGLSGLEAVRSVRPDLLLSDVVMSGMDGVKLAMLTREIVPSCIVLLFSGTAATQDLLGEARMHGYDFELLPKPIRPEQLLQRIRSLLCPSAATKHRTDLVFRPE